jgi:D-3-phosphoglycerate dehydrogenase
MKILIADKLAPEGSDYLKSQDNVSVTIQPGLSDQDLAEALKIHDGVVIRSAVKITSDILDACMPNGSLLKGIARAGVGIDNIDLKAATRYGVAVMNSASASTITTAEHAFALLIALARNIPHSHMTMAGGGWDRSAYTGVQLHGRTLGVVGFGRIGQTLAQRAIAFGMKVIAYDPYYNADSALDGAVTMVRSFDDMVPNVDAISFHVPKNETTTGMMGREQFAKARPCLLLVNASRGGIIDETALLEALDAGQCAGAAIDVYEQEPPPADSPLRNHPKIVTTPHLGASTTEAQEAVAVDACKSLLNYLRGLPVEGAVNIGSLSLDLSDRQRTCVELGSRMIALVNAAQPEQSLTGVTFTLRGESLASRADTIARYALATLLRSHLDQAVNVVNAALIAEQRNIESQTVIAADTGEDRMTIELRTHAGKMLRVEGTIDTQNRPRITHVLGYSMDMVPEGHMILLTNADEPGRIGLVGQIIGEAGVNIAEMVIGRAGNGEAGQVAMMVIKIDAEPTDALLDALRNAPGILTVASVALA